MAFEEYRWRLHVRETDFGRSCGWIVERNGRALAILKNPIQTDMFWYSYELTPLVTDDHCVNELYTEEFWATVESSGVVFRSHTFGNTASAFPGITQRPLSGRIYMRGLCIPILEPRPWDRLVLWVRRALGWTFQCQSCRSGNLPGGLDGNSVTDARRS